VSTLSFVTNFGWLLLALIVSLVSLHVVENPIRRAKLFSANPLVPVVLGVVLVATSLFVATAALAVSTGPDSTTTGGVAIDPANPFAPRINLSQVLTTAEVAKLVDGATHISAVPNNLVPSLSTVSSDWGGPPPPCAPTLAVTSEPACVYGDPHGAKTVAILGDSHVQMWFDALDFIAIRDHWRLIQLAKAGCPADDLTFAEPPGGGSPDDPYVQCSAWHRFAVARIRAIQPDLVIISQRPEDAPGGHPTAFSQWGSGLARTIQELHVPPHHVVVLGSIPETSTMGPECLAIHPTDAQACTRPNAFSSSIYNVFEQRAATRAGGRYVSVLPWFCSLYCTDIIGNFQPYWDEVHINAVYSYALVDVLASAVGLPPPVTHPLGSS
jgi:hypothetical protein